MEKMIGSGSKDRLSGSRDDDFMSGEGGNDAMRGGGGNDIMLGGGGDDRMRGNAGDDLMFGASSAGGAVDMDAFRIGQDYRGTVTFQGESAGYRNVLGMYKIADDGTIYDVEILFGNASLRGSGGDLIAGQSSVDVELHAGDRVGFFVVPNGFSRSGGERGVFGRDGGSFEFRDAEGNPGNISGRSELQLVHVDDNGAETVVRSQYGTSVFHSMTGAEGGLNGDRYDHVTGEVDTMAGSVRIGFEDLWNGGDKDFDDSVFTFDIGVTNAALLPRAETGSGSSSDNDRMSGGRGDDVMFGMRGDDVVRGGAGDDQIWGNSGDDRLMGGRGDDIIKGGSGNDRMRGGRGNDDLEGNSGDDRLSGGAGNDTLSGSSGNDRLVDGAGDDIARGGSGNDVFVAGAGDDVYIGGSGRDTLTFNRSDVGVNVDLHAHVATGLGTDRIEGIERVVGSRFDDIFKGDKRDNVFVGRDGDDTFRGLGGSDTFIGGSGADTFVWYGKDVLDQKTGEHLGVDVIRGFDADDTLDFSNMLKDMKFESLDDVIHMEETARGTMVSVQMGERFVDVVLLQGVHGMSVEDINGDDGSNV